jgi:hypothetical protein
VITSSAGDKEVQVLLTKCLGLDADTGLCSIPARLLGSNISRVLGWYKIVIDEMYRLSNEVFGMLVHNHMAVENCITPTGSIEQRFFCFPTRADVRPETPSIFLSDCQYVGMCVHNLCSS